MNGKRKPSRTSAAGFTLIELIVSIGVFAIMSVSLTAAFSSGFSTFRNSREIQRNVEATQYSMNTLAKYLRTSTVTNVSASWDSIRFYDYSSGRCFEYRFNSGALQARWVGIGTITDVMTDCSGTALASSTWQNLTPTSDSYVTGQFYAVPSNITSKSMGRVTIAVSVKRNATSSLKSDIQTTVSLRDYAYVEQVTP